MVDDSTVDVNAPENVDIDDTWDIFEDSSSNDNVDNIDSSPTPLVPSPDIHSGGDSNNHEDVPFDEPENDPKLGSHDLDTNTRKPSSRMKLYHPLDQVIGNPEEGVRTRRRARQDEVMYVFYTSTLEPKKVEEALKDEFWIEAMQN